MSDGCRSEYAVEAVGLTKRFPQRARGRKNERVDAVEAAVDNVDMENMTKAQTRMDVAVKREDPLIEQLNKFCQAP